MKVDDLPELQEPETAQVEVNTGSQTIRHVSVQDIDLYLYYPTEVIGEARRGRALNFLLDDEHRLRPDWREEVKAVEAYLERGEIPPKAKDTIKSVK